MAEFTDDRSDSEAWQGADNDIDGYLKWLPAGESPLFTAKTPTPRKAGNNWLSELDERLSRSLQDHVGHAYRDMRAQWWAVKWNGKMWTAYPTKATAEKYNAEFGTKMDPKRMYSAADDAAGMVASIEANIERDRLEAKNRGGIGWLLLVIGGMLLLGKKGKR
jgi:hypothetical protein